ncbi:MAG: 30S ribosomal protein S17e [Nanoarchaeota archaeon]|nr:30S ribosomal protein S17e [Nanoarchaeota archaeon]
MGRVRNTFIKRNVRQVMDQFSEKFSKDFESNKKKLDELVKTNSKKIRNRLAGYITKIKKTGVSLKVVE